MAKKPAAKPSTSREEIPADAVIYGFATSADRNGVRQVSIHGRDGPMSSLLARKGAEEIVLPSATIVGASPNDKYVAWDGESYVLRTTLKSIRETDNLTFICVVDDPRPVAGESDGMVDRTMSTQDAAIDSGTDSNRPRAFISYAWEGPEHEKWVTGLAERLRGESGVEITFDQWHLNLGDDRLRFMEEGVSAADFVIVICSPTYAERANRREGGVGYESSIITPEFAENLDTNKFIPVLRSGDWSASVPRYLKGRMGADLRGDPYKGTEYEKLLRTLYREPLQPPPLGQKPVFSKGTADSEASSDSNPTESSFDQERPLVPAQPGVAQPFPAAEARDGSARFRGSGQPLGQFWNTLPFAQGPDHEVFLAKGPAVWLRVMPHAFPAQEWVNDELLRCGRQPSVPLQPLLWTNLQYLRAEDGMGAYATLSPTGRDTETSSVMFVFTTGEIWCVDTTLLQMSGQGNLYFLDIARSLVQRLPGCAELLKCLGIEPHFDWIAGLDGIKGWRLNVPPPPNHINPFPGQTSLGNIAVAKGTFEPGQVPSLALRPFFAEMFKKCGMTIPAHIEEAIRGNRKF